VLSRIFEPFFTTKGPGKGTGLGLYNVKTIINKMVGKIAVHSREHEGTKITITFPPSKEGPS
jgi:signal transduction histidine kinase